MTSIDAKESQTATQTVSVMAMPTTSTNVNSTEAENANQLVKKIGTVEELNELLSDATKVILIEFFAEWCGPCKLIAQKLETWAVKYDITIVKIDIDELEDVAIEYNVAGIPSFTFIKDRTILEQLEGSQDDKIIAALEKYCKVSTDASAHKKRSSHRSESKKKTKAKSSTQDLSNIKAEEAEKAQAN